jgi:aspartyl-tRNA(Asn)/glutamyl-tRNA(Gln) amidotransferase subunit A
MRIALPREFLAEGIDPEVKACILRAAALYESLGARVTEVSMPALNNALPAYYVISSAEASSNLARFDGVRYGYRAPDTSDINELYKATRTAGFGSEVKRRIMLGTFALSSGYYDAYYKKALQVRTLIAREYERVFSDCDIILSPVAPTTAYKIGEKTASPMEMYLGDIYTVPINIAGVPALSIPCGADEKGLPVGMQLVGKPFSEQTLYRRDMPLNRFFCAGKTGGFKGGGAMSKNYEMVIGLRCMWSLGQRRSCSAAAPRRSAPSRTRSAARCARACPERCRCQTAGLSILP